MLRAEQWGQGPRGREAARFPLPQMSSRSPPSSWQLRVAPHDSVEPSERGPARPLSTARLPLGAESRRDRPGEPRSRRGRIGSASERASAQPGIEARRLPLVQACWFQGQLRHGVSGTGGCTHPVREQPWRGAAGTGVCTPVTTHTRVHSPAHTHNTPGMCPDTHAHTCVPTHMHAHTHPCTHTPALTRTHMQAQPRGCQPLSCCWGQWSSRSPASPSPSQPA